MGAGVGTQLLVGQGNTDIEEARLATVPQGVPTTNQGEQDYIEGAIALSLMPPGVSPWVGARAGVGATSDAGVTYTGRTVRVDARHAFEGEETALSAGLGLSGVLTRPGSDAPEASGSPGGIGGTREGDIPGLDSDGVTGFGFDIPVIVGYRSDVELVQVWGGLRGGWERLSGEFLLRVDPDPTIVETAPVEASRWHAGALAGLAVGVRPVRVAVEVDVAYQRATGRIQLDDLEGTTVRNAKLDGWTIAPTGAIIGEF
jgi:hypothetical protein